MTDANKIMFNIFDYQISKTSVGIVLSEKTFHFVKSILSPHPNFQPKLPSPLQPLQNIKILHLKLRKSEPFFA